MKPGRCRLCTTLSILSTKMLLRVLFAGLKQCQWVFTDRSQDMKGDRMNGRCRAMPVDTKTYLCWFANLLAYSFPLICIVFLDRGKQRCTLLPHQYWFAAAF